MKENRMARILRRASMRPWTNYIYGNHYGFNISKSRKGTCKIRVYECHAMAGVKPIERDADMELIEIAVNHFENMRDVIALLLPMAKEYAHKNNVGGNRSVVEFAEKVFNEVDNGLTKSVNP